MAMAKKCDRCGAFYENYTTQRSKKEGRVNTIQTKETDENGNIAFTVNTYDLCPDCMKEFFSWFDLGKYDRED